MNEARKPPPLTVHEVWKYELDFDSIELRLDMPRDAVLLHFGNQHEVPCLWAKVDPTRALKPRHFKVFGTGPPGDVEGAYVGTALFRGGHLVVHLFEVQ